MNKENGSHFVSKLILYTFSTKCVGNHMNVCAIKDLRVLFKNSLKIALALS